MKKQIPWNIIISHLKEEAGPENEIALEQWRTTDENNILYLELVSLWEEIQKEAGSYQTDTEHLWQRLEVKIDGLEQKKETLSISLRKIRVAVAAACILLIVSISLSYFIGQRTSEPAMSSQTYMAMNGKSRMTLPDGSTVWLNIGSTLSYETSFLNQRIVKLDGEALFDVKKDEKHPFIVDADNIHIKVLGTRFNVQAYGNKTDIRVALLEGRVSIWANNDDIEIIPGEIASFNKETKFLNIEKNDVGFESFWADNSCTFTAKTLGHICKYLEKWYNINISLDPTISESYIYTFTITDEPLETILQIMSRINPIRYSFEENNEVIIQHVEF